MISFDGNNGLYVGISNILYMNACQNCVRISSLKFDFPTLVTSYSIEMNSNKQQWRLNETSIVMSNT